MERKPIALRGARHLPAALARSGPDTLARPEHLNAKQTDA